MPNAINTNQLTPGNVFLVRGLIGFSRLSRHTTDEERFKENERRIHKIDKNYTTATIYNAQVLAQNPQAPTIEEQYGLGALYASNKPQDYPGNNFTARNKSSMLPRVYKLKEGADPVTKPDYQEIQLEGELQKGTDVTLVLRVFDGQGNNGISLDTVLINQTDFQYYGNNAAVQNALAAFGIVTTELPADARHQVNTSVPNQTTDTGNTVAEQPAPTMVETPFGSFAQAPIQNSTQAAPDVTAAPPIQFGAGPNRTY